MVAFRLQRTQDCRRVAILVKFLHPAGVAELADARDSKSRDLHWSCGFDPHLRHQLCVTYCAAMRTKFLLPLCLVVAFTACWAAPTVQILTELPSPQPVGKVIGIAVVGKDEGEPEKYAALLRYRLSVADEGDTFHVVRDFSRQSEFTWMPGLYEHE